MRICWVLHYKQGDRKDDERKQNMSEHTHSLATIAFIFAKDIPEIRRGGRGRGRCWVVYVAGGPWPAVAGAEWRGKGP